MEKSRIQTGAFACKVAHQPALLAPVGGTSRAHAGTARWQRTFSCGREWRWLLRQLQVGCEKSENRVADFAWCMDGGHYSVALGSKRPVQFIEGTAVATLFRETSPYPSGFPFGQSLPQLLASQITCKQPALFCPERHCPWWPLSNKESAQAAWVLRPAHHKSPCPPARSHCEAAKYKPSFSPLLRRLTLGQPVKTLFLKAGNARSGAACHHSARPKALSYTSRSNRVYDFFSSVAPQEGQKTRIAKKSYCGQGCCQGWRPNHLPLLGSTT